jgi:hypothetical protein
MLEKNNNNFLCDRKKAARIIHLENLTKKEKREKSCKKRIEILHDNAHTHK